MSHIITDASSDMYVIACYWHCA